MDPSTSYPPEDIVPLPPHPFQVSPESLRCAYAEMQTTEGLFLRLDLPGVDPSVLKVELKVKEVDKEKLCTLTISAQLPALENWPELTRIYATNIIFDRIISQHDYNYTLVNGSLRIFFSPPGLKTQVAMFRGVPPAIEAPTDEHKPEIRFGTYASRVPHFLGCPCCQYGQRYNAGQIEITNGLIHINPFAIGAMRGCLLTKVVKKGPNYWNFELLMEAPGLLEYKVETSAKVCILKGGPPEKADHTLEVFGRAYFLSIRINCSCCIFKDYTAKHWVKNGLFGLTIPISK